MFELLYISLVEDNGRAKLEKSLTIFNIFAVASFWFLDKIGSKALYLERREIGNICWMNILDDFESLLFWICIRP